MSLNFDVLKQTEDFLEELVPEIPSSREDWKPQKLTWNLKITHLQN